MKQVNLWTYLGSATLLLTVAGCSGTGLVDLGASAGSGNSTGAAGDDLATGGPVSKMTVRLGESDYKYSCGATGASFGGGWQGPDVSAATQDAGSNGCTAWPRSNPYLQLHISFTGFLPSVGFPAGTYDLSRPDFQSLAVELSAQSQDELPVGQYQPYATYSSLAANIYEVTPPIATAVGASGALTVAKYGPASPSDGYDVPFDVSLTNVVLPMLSNNGGNFPSRVTIESARLVSFSQ